MVEHRLRAQKAGGDGQRRHVVRMEVAGHRVGEPHDRVLGQVVEEVAAVAEGVAVRDLDDEPGVAFDHQGGAVAAGDDVRVDGALEQFHPRGG